MRSITDTSTVAGRTTRSRWDRAARTSTTTLPSGLAATSTFDALGQLVREDTPGVTAVTYGYDEHGRPKHATQGERSSSVAYDAYGWLDSFRPTRSAAPRAISADALGRVETTTLPDGREVRFTYTPAGDLESITPPSRPAHGFLFTLTGLRDAYKAADDPRAVTRYRYDDDQQLKAVERPDGTTLELDRDTDGYGSCATARGQSPTSTHRSPGRCRASPPTTAHAQRGRTTATCR